MDPGAMDSRVTLPVLCTHLDHTFVDHADESQAALRALQHQLEVSPVFLIYNSGRCPADIFKLMEETQLKAPDIIIGAMGTQVLIGNRPDADWEAYLDSGGWDPALLQTLVERYAPSARPPPEGMQGGRLILSYHMDSANGVQPLRDGLREEGFGEDKVHVIYHNGRYLDIVPAQAGKGNALRFVLERLARERGVVYEEVAGRTLVCGDSGNDVLMMQTPGVHGCVVGNADQDLLGWLAVQPSNSEFPSRLVHYEGKRCAWAILAAILKLGFCSA